jgi:hypothetical protein
MKNQRGIPREVITDLHRQLKQAHKTIKILKREQTTSRKNPFNYAKFGETFLSICLAFAVVAIIIIVGADYGTL